MSDEVIKMICDAAVALGGMALIGFIGWIILKK